jgi:hypothetical protein
MAELGLGGESRFAGPEGGIGMRKVLSGRLSLVLLLFVGLLVFGSCGKEESAATTPEALAISVWGQAESEDDSGILSLSFENGVLAVWYQYFPWDGEKALPEAEREIAELLEKVFAAFPGVREIRAFVSLPLDDVYGKRTWVWVYADMTNATYAKVNWDNFDPASLPTICDDWSYGP